MSANLVLTKFNADDKSFDYLFSGPRVVIIETVLPSDDRVYSVVTFKGEETCSTSLGVEFRSLRVAVSFAYALAVGQSRCTITADDYRFVTVLVHHDAKVWEHDAEWSYLTRRVEHDLLSVFSANLEVVETDGSSTYVLAGRGR